MAWNLLAFKPDFYIFSYNEQLRKVIRTTIIITIIIIIIIIIIITIIIIIINLLNVDNQNLQILFIIKNSYL